MSPMSVESMTLKAIQKINSKFTYLNRKIKFLNSEFEDHYLAQWPFWLCMVLKCNLQCEVTSLNYEECNSALSQTRHNMANNTVLCQCYHGWFCVWTLLYYLLIPLLFCKRSVIIFSNTVLSESCKYLILLIAFVISICVIFAIILCVMTGLSLTYQIEKNYFHQ